MNFLGKKVHPYSSACFRNPPSCAEARVDTLLKFGVNRSTKSHADGEVMVSSFDPNSGTKPKKPSVVPDMLSTYSGKTRTVRIHSKSATTQKAVEIMRDVRSRIQDERILSDKRLSQVVSPYEADEQDFKHFRTECWEDMGNMRNPGADLKRRITLVNQVIAAEGTTGSEDGFRDVCWRISRDLKSAANTAEEAIERSNYLETNLKNVTDALLAREAQALRESAIARAREAELRMAAEKKDFEQNYTIARLRSDLAASEAARAKADERAAKVLEALVKTRPASSEGLGMISPRMSFTPLLARPMSCASELTGSPSGSEDVPLSGLRFKASGGAEVTTRDLQPQNEEEVHLQKRHERAKVSSCRSNVSTCLPTQSAGTISDVSTGVLDPKEPVRGRKTQIRILSEMRERIRRERLIQDGHFLSIVF